MRLNTKKYKNKVREPHYTKKKAMHNKGKKHRKTKKAMVIKKKKCHSKKKRGGKIQTRGVDIITSLHYNTEGCVSDMCDDKDHLSDACKASLDILDLIHQDFTNDEYLSYVDIRNDLSRDQKIEIARRNFQRLDSYIGNLTESSSANPSIASRITSLFSYKSSKEPIASNDVDVNVDKELGVENKLVLDSLLKVINPIYYFYLINSHSGISERNA